MIVKTNGLVLRTHPVSNTSRIVVWLTQRHGQIHTLIKGALRPKSLFLGQFDLFYTCELLFYAREQRQLFIARECYPLNTRPSLRTKWRASAAASYFCDFIRRITLQRAPAPELYQLLDHSLDILQQRDGHRGFLYWFELKVLHLLGLTPRLSHCMTCNRPLDVQSRNQRFSYSDGGMLCGEHAHHTSTHYVSPDALALLNHWQKTSHPRTVFNTRMRPQQEETIRSVLALFCQYHLDIPGTSRAIALDILDRTLAQQEPDNDSNRGEQKQS